MVGSCFRYDQTFDFDVSRAALWAALNDTERFAKWWPWLRSFATTEPTLVPGTAATCAVRGPLPYTLDFRVTVDRVEPGHAVDTIVTGDLAGPARLEVSGGEATSTARLTWAVELRLPILSAASRVARPVLTWAHDRVVANGVGQFRAHALTAPPDRIR